MKAPALQVNQAIDNNRMKVSSEEMRNLMDLAMAIRGDEKVSGHTDTKESQERRLYQRIEKLWPGTNVNKGTRILLIRRESRPSS